MRGVHCLRVPGDMTVPAALRGDTSMYAEQRYVYRRAGKALPSTPPRLGGAFVLL
jgi:hypothetical protein